MIPLLGSQFCISEKAFKTMDGGGGDSCSSWSASFLQKMAE